MPAIPQTWRSDYPPIAQGGGEIYGLVAPSIVRRRDLISVALRLARPFDLTGLKDSVWPLSFWKEVYRQYQLQTASTHSIVDPVVGCVNSRIAEHKDPQIPNAIRC
jgi:hypothetical protein